MNIYLSEIGGPAGVGVLKLLNKIPKTYSIGSDCDPLASGQMFADEFLISPNAKKFCKEYEIFLDKLLKEKQINIVFPTGENDLKILASKKDIFPNISIFISDLNVIEICQDKKIFFETLKDKFSNYIPYTINHKLLYSKPRRGAGSRDTKLIQIEEDHILQEYLPGREFTVDVFCDMNFESMGTVVRERISVKSGISTQSKVYDYKSNIGYELTEISEQICKYLKIQGPCCIQYKEDANGNFKLLELNPRLGGTSIASALAGVNYVEMYMNLHLGKKVKKTYPKPIIVSRYYEETIIK